MRSLQSRASPSGSGDTHAAAPSSGASARRRIDSRVAFSTRSTVSPTRPKRENCSIARSRVMVMTTITAIVVLNALLGYFQEARAERSVRALMALAAPESTVIRDGERQRIAAHDLVPGDVVLVEAGDKIPADARIIEDANLHTDEAPLTDHQKITG